MFELLLILNFCLNQRLFRAAHNAQICCSFAVVNMLKHCGGCGGPLYFPRWLEVLVVGSITLHKVLLQTLSSFLLHATGNKWVCFSLLDNKLMCWKMLPIHVFPNGLKSSLNLLACGIASELLHTTLSVPSFSLLCPGQLLVGTGSLAGRVWCLRLVHG